MHSLTSDGRRYQLRVDLRAANGTQYYEIYDDFSIGPARDFTLHIGNHRGTAGGCMYIIIEDIMGTLNIIHRV